MAIQKTGNILSRIVNWTFPGSNQAPKRSAEQQLPKGQKSVSDLIEPVPESRAFGDLVDMMNCDYQIKFANYVIAANVAAVQVSISIEGGTGSPKEAALQEKLQKLWDRSVSAMMPSIGFGRVAFEKSWHYDEKNQLTVIDKLEPMEFQDSRLKLDEDHCYDGFDVRIKRSPDEWKPVDRVNSWWLAINATAKNPHGISHYKGAVEAAWNAKRLTMHNREIYVRRFAIRGGIARGPETVRDERTGQIISGAEAAIQASDSLYTGGTMFVSNEPHHDNNMAQAGKYEWEYDEANVVALDPQPILNVVDKDDVAILRAFGIPEKAAIEGDSVGSLAMVSEQILILFAVVDSILAQWVESFNAYVCKLVGEANFGTNGPEFVANAVKLTNRPDSFVVQLVTALSANPQFQQIFLSGGVDLRSILEKLGLPVSPQLEAIAQQVAARMSATQGAIGGQGPGQPAGQPAGGDQAPAGEFSQTSTLQMNRTLKATHAILDRFINGSSAAVTQTMLEAIGWSPERAKVLIQDAADGTVDDDLQDAPQDTPGSPVAMRNLINGQRAEFKAFLGDLVKKKSLKN